MDITSGSAGTQTEVHVMHINRTDVILGRGRGDAYSRSGNIAYRHILWSLRTKYKAARHSGKGDVGKCVVDKIHRLGGRFLAQDPQTKKYYEVSDDQAVIKACQSLREKKMGKPAGFDQNFTKITSKWIAQIENGPITPPSVCESSSKNFKVSEMFSEALISALSGMCSNDTLWVPTPSVVSNESVENHAKHSNSEKRTIHRQVHPSTATSLKSGATKYSSHYQELTASEKESEAVANNDMLRSLMPDPFTAHGEGRHVPVKPRFDDNTLCLPAHIKSFFKGLLDRYIPDQDSKDEDEWINIVTQTTLDLKDTDNLGNDDLSVLLDQH
jgi:hypothetical protein